MAEYIDGFVFPIAANRVEEYQRVARAVAAIYKQHGAIDYVEFVGDDMHRDGTRPFPEMVEAQDGETVVFGWITYASDESRDQINALVESDPRMPELLAPLFDDERPVFAPERMAFGGFVPLVRSSSSDA